MPVAGTCVSCLSTTEVPEIIPETAARGQNGPMPDRPRRAASEPKAPAPRRRVSASRRAYDWVRTRILNGAYEGGRLLSEGEVADAIGVSRTPVREAFLQLSGEGMLALYPKRGALVVPVSADELREVLVARALIEPWAAGVVAAEVDRETDVASLREIVERGATALERDDRQGFHEADRAFHEHLVAAAGNRILASFYSSLHDLQVRGGSLAARAYPSRGADAVAQHKAIADAIARGDAETAVALARVHVHDTALALGLAAIP